MKKFYSLLQFSFLFVFLIGSTCLSASTSVIISANRTESGLPLMFNLRDTDCPDSRVQWFKEDSVAFVGIVDALNDTVKYEGEYASCAPDSGVVWAGINNFGFAICYNKVYNFEEDSLTAEYKSELLDHKKDSLRFAKQYSETQIKIKNLKKEKDFILADTLRVRYNNDLDSLKRELEYEAAAIDSLNILLAAWRDTIAANPDTLPSLEIKDMEGRIMYRALSTCATVADFLNMLDSLVHPLGIQANFALLDNAGGAIYVEANNWRYVVYDVNEEGQGYRVQTNFAFAGTMDEYKGYERYLTADAAMHDLNDHWTHQPIDINHQWMFNHLARSYRHEILGYAEGYCPPAGIVVDQDFIPSRTTSAAVVFEGPAMWTVLGYPACAVALPALVCDQDRLPEAMKRTENDSTAALANMAMQIKMEHVFPDPVSNGKHYLHLSTILFGKKRHPSMMSCSLKAEKQINAQYYRIYNLWKAEKMSDQQFFAQYQNIAAGFPAIYARTYRKYLQKPQPSAPAPQVAEQPVSPAAVAQSEMPVAEDAIVENVSERSIVDDVSERSIVDDVSERSDLSEPAPEQISDNSDDKHSEVPTASSAATALE